MITLLSTSNFGQSTVIMTTSYGQWLKAKRGRRGEPGFVSQEELAQKIGVSRTYVNQIEAKPAGSPPNYETRQKIHAALGTSEEELRRLGIVAGGVMHVAPATARVDAHGSIRTGTLTVTGGKITATDPDPTPDIIRRWAAAMTDRERRLMWDYLKSYILVDRLDDYRDDEGSDREEREP
jgi:transcriptional regulator with XRE-family HTH domain